MSSKSIVRITLSGFLFVVLSACQSQLALMPTPEVLKDPRFDVFAANPAPLESNEITTFYVTSRLPSPESSSSFFSSKIDREALHFGPATVRIGAANLDLVELMQQSTAEDRQQKLVLTLIEAPIFASANEQDVANPDSPLSPSMQAFLDQLNRAIDASITKRLTVYAHGASNTFEWSVSQGAQYQYFTGNNEVLLTFAWPSPGKEFGYLQDKARATDSAADFAYIIEFLARHSNAERINVIGFSAGGRVVGGGLGLLGSRYQDPADLRLGQVYLAQSDQPLEDFLVALPKFYPLVTGLTVSVDPADSVLAMARLTDTKMRLGAPSRGSVTNDFGLDESAAAQLKGMINSDRMAVIDLSKNLIKGFKFSHGAWYDNPWVSTDALVFLLDGLPAADRGLDSYVSELDYEIWFFPEDYLERVKAALLALAEGS